MASSVTMLAWGLVEYRDAYELAGELQNGLDCIKWPLDYFIKAHVADNKFYGQVGLGETDHDYWGRPEDMTMGRPASLLDEAHGGSEVAAETAAAMAAASIAFRPTDSAYADPLLQHARQLYDFGYNVREIYHHKISDAEDFYPSTSYNDELAWGAMWLHRATNDTDYLRKAEEFLSSDDVAYAMSWDDKDVGAQLLYYIATGDQAYQNIVERFLQNWFPGGDIPYTKKGLAFRAKWGSLRYSANTALVALVAADYGILPDEGRDFAQSQIDYMMGSSGRSFIVGYGQNPPVQPHHAAASCPSSPAECGWSQFEADAPNPHVLYGAMVGGPTDTDDTYVDKRSDSVGNEVTTDYNAGLQSSVAGRCPFCCHLGTFLHELVSHIYRFKLASAS
ncbi:hypothetical protein NP493_470g01004 [Ridgeia piscesae]|uniref:cellulase n=1 Tax=Ridgeia piscesae TaxID=27915 RepID=A0AAD9KYR4_RIDPI|nr:hypothetical protein NP493_470g01004 [Ridgeia piscesae]